MPCSAVAKKTAHAMTTTAHTLTAHTPRVQNGNHKSTWAASRVADQSSSSPDPSPPPPIRGKCAVVRRMEFTGRIWPVKNEETIETSVSYLYIADAHCERVCGLRFHLCMNVQCTVWGFVVPRGKSRAKNTLYAHTDTQKKSTKYTKKIRTSAVCPFNPHLFKNT